jgi:hypothetical protein
MPARPHGKPIGIAAAFDDGLLDLGFRKWIAVRSFQAGDAASGRSRARPAPEAGDAPLVPIRPGLAGLGRADLGLRVLEALLDLVHPALGP